MLGHLFHASCCAVLALSRSDETDLVKQVKMQSPGLPLPEVPILASIDGELRTTLRLTAAKLVGENISLITRMFNSTIPGPTLVVNPGDRLYIKYANALGANHGPTAFNSYHQPNTTNLHVHGLHVSPLAPADDIFGMVAPPGETLQYKYKLPADHSPGTYWLHPHHHGSLVIV
jgi:FtsP/CotA-like multicopper oxidase with cupredoxin domain